MSAVLYNKNDDIGCPEVNGLKKKKTVTGLLSAVLLAGCINTADTKVNENNFREFFYTYSNINYNAFYQRYHFYNEEGRHMFFHERREVENDYGPAGEKDITLTGAFELTEEEWTEFFEYLSDGSAEERSDSAETGDAGPWLYLYLGDDTEGLEFSFSSIDRLKSFEEFCRTLAEEGRD